jgi:hypothetical protein
LKLTKAKIGELMKKIEETNLPKTFRDAITITRKLGLSHLWIDSLCICQDDLEDWKAESKKMADVYGGSSCNILLPWPTMLQKAAYLSLIEASLAHA